MYQDQPWKCRFEYGGNPSFDFSRCPASTTIALRVQDQQSREKNLEPTLVEHLSKRTGLKDKSCVGAPADQVADLDLYLPVGLGA